MASKPQDSQNPDTQPQDQQTQIIPFTSITLSLPKHLPIHFIPPPTLSPNTPKLPTFIKLPTQITSIFNLSITHSISKPSKSIPKSITSKTPLLNPLPITPNLPTDPSNAAALRRASVVLFRSDLRVNDNESLISANNESISVLPVYCFDVSECRNSKLGFLIESVKDLRRNLQARGSDLIVRVGKPETVLVELVKEVKADGVYMHREVSNDEVKGEQKIESVLKVEGVEVKCYWGSTLYHVDDLPFKLEDIPMDYGGFREKVKGVKVRSVVEVVDRLKGLPAGGNVDPGEIPSLADLGLDPVSDMTRVKPVNKSTLIGGETEALNRLKRFATEFQGQPPKETKDGNNDSIYGANFSCKISPWLAMGCVSPRAVFDELKKSTSRTISASSNGKDGDDSGMNWLMYELLWRDFFRFVTRKYSSSKQHNKAPVTA
ncbi:blue-light photoreceptor PHR2-like [Bidens hawaiensis]|uniref:blue-light photoreceptor PHR2-like n=1 Tax=Bidens hawaiensis TaxID=980011 RepID=UPI00404A562D